MHVRQHHVSSSATCMSLHCERRAWLCRGMNWSTERSEIGATDCSMFRDHFDASNWQETFCEDPIIVENEGPSKNVALEFCADGVNPYKRKSYSMWFGALSILNLPPASRHTVDTMHLCFIVPGPKKPVCLPAGIGVCALVRLLSHVKLFLGAVTTAEVVCRADHT